MLKIFTEKEETEIENEKMREGRGKRGKEKDFKEGSQKCGKSSEDIKKIVNNVKKLREMGCLPSYQHPLNPDLSLWKR